jgi:excinuclease ABC subunit A
LPALTARLNGHRFESKASDRLGEEADEDPGGSGAAPGARMEGAESLSQVVLVDQSILGKTPRSNPAVYIGAFDHIREVFADSAVARRKGLSAGAFSFNSVQGRCERCHGAGYEKIEMQFLSDVFIRCPDCNGRRYRAHILEIRLKADGEAAGVEGRGTGLGRGRPARNAAPGPRSYSIADLLEATVEEAIDFLCGFPQSRPARRAVRCLRWLEEVGLGYLQLGQPINTLSGGESQRLKLVRHLAEVQDEAAETASGAAGAGERASGLATRGRDQPVRTGSVLFLFDEPTTGLHFEDIRLLLKVFNRLVDAGHSVVVIEHNLEVIKSADWLIDLGPDAGDQGGRLVAQGTPEQVAACPESHTGAALRSVGLEPEAGS